jgi:hypothetical protein
MRTKSKAVIFHKGVLIWPANYCGMYSAIVQGHGKVAADTLPGIKQLINEAISKAK